MSPIGYRGGREVMPLGTLHTVRGVIKLREGPRFFIIVDEGGEWELELDARLVRYVDHSVTIEGFNRLEVVRIKRDGEDWPAGQSWTRWFNRWRKRRDG
jgi:hypothetical protein